MDAILTHFLRDDAGTPLGRGMPSGRPLREDGQSHYGAWQALVRRDPCAYCPGPSGTVDHIEPRSRPARGVGSAHGWLNTIGACTRCNGAKRDLELLEFLRRRRWTVPILEARGRGPVPLPARSPRPRSLTSR